MAIEIERKFLVVGDGWRALGTPVLYRQGYVCSGSRTVTRVRVRESEAFLAVKGGSVGHMCEEFEYPIPLADAVAMLDTLSGPLVEKYRTRAVYKGLVWEIDEFLGANAGLIVAEVELAHPEQPVVLPAWAGEEVTGDPRYYNANLALAPYSSWPSFSSRALRSDAPS